MRLGLLGFPIAHSLSPKLYEKFLGRELVSYQLFEIMNPDDVPSLGDFRKKIDGLSITSPYKKKFFDHVIIESPLVQALGSVNTLSFQSDGKIFATNTDVIAVTEILKRYQVQYPKLKIILLGDGVMGHLAKIVANNLKISLIQFSRKLTPNFSKLDLSVHQELNQQNLIINSCSRDFIFQGRFGGDEIFWDYNYSFIPHQKSLPSLVKTYCDGQEMLELQALAAIKFWKQIRS